MKSFKCLSAWPTMATKPRTVSIASFSSLFLFLIVYLKFTYLAEEESPLQLLPREVTCPDTTPAVRNGSRTATAGGRIFFLETSDNTSPSFQIMCAVESAALANPSAKITILMKGLTGQKQSLPKNFGISFLSCFSNVEFLPLDFEKLFSDTPLSAWYTMVENNLELVDYATLSDACRLAILWKSGGIYLDTDFVILKNLENITNAMSVQSLYTINGAFLTFQAQHKFIELCMKDFVARYNYWLYGHQGPQLLTRVFKRWCAIHRLRDKTGCRGVNVLPKESFYPVEWQNWKKYFQPIDLAEVKTLLKNSYGVHLWNKKSKGRRLEVGSFLEQLQSQFCPRTNAMMKLYL